LVQKNRSCPMYWFSRGTIHSFSGLCLLSQNKKFINEFSVVSKQGSQ
jgi:hypothetical protein